MGVVSSNPLVGHISRYEMDMSKDMDPMLIEQSIPLSLLEQSIIVAADDLVMTLL